MFVKIFFTVLVILVLLLGISLVILTKKVRFFRNREKIRQKYMEDVFHELKTPLAAIKVLADSLLSQEDAGIDIYREFMEDIRMEADRENNIICDFLSLIRLENMERQIDITEFSVNELTEDMIELFACAAEEKKIVLSFEAQQEIKICSDRRRVREILMNLVENAIKYTNINRIKNDILENNAEYGFVRIELFSEKDMCCIKISDSGIGIPEEEQKKVFERFYRGKSMASQEAGGTGLGLSIVFSSITALSGSIELESTEGKGSIFTIKIPIKK